LVPKKISVSCRSDRPPRGTFQKKGGEIAGFARWYKPDRATGVRTAFGGKRKKEKGKKGRVDETKY